MRVYAETMRTRGPLRWVWLAAGLAFVALGMIGALLPLMPTTIFIILAALCFARSSPRLERWLMRHPRFGATLRAWRAEGAVPLRAKIYACVGMSAGFVLFLITAHPAPWLTACVALMLAACAIYIISRPTPA